jgi:hypothetical protein
MPEQTAATKDPAFNAVDHPPPLPLLTIMHDQQLVTFVNHLRQFAPPPWPLAHNLCI